MTRFEYHDEMEVSRQEDFPGKSEGTHPGRLGGRRVGAVAPGTPPTVAEAAEEAKVSRATAYRYFPTQEALLIEIASLTPLVKPVEKALDELSTDDVEAWLLVMIDTLNRRRWPTRSKCAPRCAPVPRHVARRLMETTTCRRCAKAGACVGSTK